MQLNDVVQKTDLGDPLDTVAPPDAPLSDVPSGDETIAATDIPLIGEGLLTCTPALDEPLGAPPTTCATTPQPAYIWVYAHHYLGGGGTYPTVAELEQLRLAVKAAAIPVTFFFDGILMDDVLADPGGAALLAKLKTLQTAGLMNFGYHGEETHGPDPVPTEMKKGKPLDDFTLFDEWDTAFQEVSDFAQYSHSYTFITKKDEPRCDAEVSVRTIDRNVVWTLDTTAVGGVKRVTDELGELAIGCYHGTESPPMQMAYQGVANIDVLQATVPVTAHVLDAATMDVEKLMDVGGDGDLFYYLGKLNTKEREDSEITFCTPKFVEKSMKLLDRTERPRLAAYLMEYYTGDTSALELELAVLKAFVADPANATSRFVTPQDLEDLVEPQTVGSVPMNELQALARAIVAGIALAAPPDYLGTKKRYYTLAEAYHALALALSDYASTGALPSAVTPTTGLLGPIGEPGNLVSGGSATRKESVADIATAAAAALVQLGVATATQAPHVPYTTTIGTSEVNSGEMLLAMALAFQKIRACGSSTDQIPVAMLSIMSPYAELLDPVYAAIDHDDLPLWYAKLQLWTVKPAYFKCVP